MQSGQNKVSNLEDVLIDPFELLSSQKNNLVLLKINPDNLDEHQTSLAKNILPDNGSLTEKDDIDLDLNISGDKFDCKFPSGQRVFLIQHPYPISILPMYRFEFTSSLSQYMNNNVSI